MEIYIAFGVVAAVMLGITFLFFHYKNWLLLKKNRAYIAMLFTLLLAVAADVLCGAAEVYLALDREWVEPVSRIFMSVCVMWLFFFLCLYDLSMVGRLRLVRTNGFRLLTSLLIAVSVLSVAAPLLGDNGLYNVQRCAYHPVIHLLQVLSAVLFICLGVTQIIRQEEELLRREYLIMMGTHILLLCDIAVQNIIHARNLISYLTMSQVLIFYYILLHNHDQYVSFTSRCFNRNGFQKILEEKAGYKEDFSCLGICVNNVESITNFCDEAEIHGLLKQLGTILKNSCGRHRVYQIHSFEYMVVLQDSQTAEWMHTYLRTHIPPYFRIHDKNVPLLCGFYAVNFFDAGYDRTSFNRIISSMRRLTMGQTDRDELLQYNGENQKKIQQNLDAMQLVSQCIAQHFFELDCAVLQPLDETAAACEMILCKRTGVAEVISQERIWKIASDFGSLRQVGYIMMELVCRELVNRDRQQKIKQRVHINLTSGQIANETLAAKYIDILKSYGIARNRICVEVTLDLTVNYDGLLKALAVFRENGVQLLLDQFGVTVCNLKNVLNMPFDGVKVNHYMVAKFCEGDSHQLTYLIRMLNNKNWRIYLDGIDNLTNVDTLRGMSVYAVQGMAVTRQTARQIAGLMKIPQQEGEETEGRYRNA